MTSHDILLVTYTILCGKRIVLQDHSVWVVV